MFAHSSHFNMIGRGKGGKEKGKGLDKNKIESFHTTKSIMIHFVVSTWIDLKQIRSKEINQYNIMALLILIGI